MPIGVYILGSLVCGLLLVLMAYKRQTAIQETKLLNRLQTVVERLESAANNSTRYGEEINDISTKLAKAEAALCLLMEDKQEVREKLAEIHALNKDFRLILGPLLKGVLKSGRATITVEYDENQKVKVEVI